MKARKPKQPKPEGPTRERLRHAGRGGFHIGGDDRTARIYRMHDVPIEKLAITGKLSEGQFEALSRLWSHWYAAHLSGPIKSMDFEQIAVSRTNGGPVDDLALRNRDAFAVMWKRLEPLECVVVETVALCELSLQVAGAAIGFRSPCRGREAALGLLQSAADRLAGRYARQA